MSHETSAYPPYTLHIIVRTPCTIRIKTVLRDQKAVAPFKRITLAFYEASVASNLRRAMTQ